MNESDLEYERRRQYNERWGVERFLGRTFSDADPNIVEYICMKMPMNEIHCRRLLLNLRVAVKEIELRLERLMKEEKKPQHQRSFIDLEKGEIEAAEECPDEKEDKKTSPSIKDGERINQKMEG